MATKKAARKRELIEPTPGDKRYVRRDKEGKFKDVVDVGKSLAADRRSKSKTLVKPGQGDKGDMKRSPSTKAASSTKKTSPKKTASKK
jgi:hypothetical protein